MIPSSYGPRIHHIVFKKMVLARLQGGDNTRPNSGFGSVDIPESEKTPLVLTLLAIIENQSNIIDQLTEEIQLLKDEIARLKGQKPKPKIHPSRLESSKTKMSKSAKNN